MAALYDDSWRETPCIEPGTGASTHNGYAILRRDGRNWLAHRYAWTLANGPIPSGALVLHKCDNRRCVAVPHLFLGSPKDNSADMSNKARWRNQAKLTREDAGRIRAAIDAGVKRRALAEQYGVSEGTISNIFTGHTWNQPGGTHGNETQV